MNAAAADLGITAHFCDDLCAIVMALVRVSEFRLTAACLMRALSPARRTVIPGTILGLSATSSALPGNFSLTITTSDLGSPPTTVTIGGQPCVITSATATSTVCTVPAAVLPGAADIAIECAGNANSVLGTAAFFYCAWRVVRSRWRVVRRRPWWMDVAG